MKTKKPANLSKETSKQIYDNGFIEGFNSALERMGERLKENLKDYLNPDIERVFFEIDKIKEQMRK